MDVAATSLRVQCLVDEASSMRNVQGAPLNQLIDRAQCKAVRIDKSVEGFLSF